MASPQQDGWLLYTDNISKSFGSTKVLDKVNLGLRPGEVMGLVGPNGAGKTTLLNILAGMFPADSGSVWIENGWVDFDRQPERRRVLGLMLGGRLVVEELKPGEYFEFVAAMYGANGTAAATVGDLIRALRLESHLAKQIKDLSAGTKKKVEFIASVLHGPRVLLYDEPFEAIDPPAVADLTVVTRDFVKANGAAAIISSHILPYVRPLATTIQLLWEGRLYEPTGLQEELRSRGDDSELMRWQAVLEGR
jgi:ABC-2 type transport system ATP-binding protein